MWKAKWTYLRMVLSVKTRFALERRNKLNDDQKRKMRSARLAGYDSMTEFRPETWSATHIPIYQPKVTMCTDVHKKCMCCEKVYSADTDQKYCSCKAHGYLYAVGYLYRKKGGEAIETRRDRDYR